MNDQIKDRIKRIMEQAETRAAKSLLRWKYQKEGKAVPVDTQLDSESRRVAEQATEVIARRGKNIFNELKKVYLKKDDDEEGQDR
jgi:hypothetical protein